MSTPTPLVPETAKICTYKNGKRSCVEVPKVVVFSQKGCFYCSQARGKLQSLGAPYRDLDVTSNPKNFGLMMQVSSQPGTPVLLIGKKVVIGYDSKAIERAWKTVVKSTASRKRRRK